MCIMSIAEQLPPAGRDCGNRIWMLLRWEDMGQSRLARRAFQPGQQLALVGTCAANTYSGLLIFEWRIVELDDVEQLVGDPVGPGQPPTPARKVGLLHAPRLRGTILGANEQAVLTGSNHSDLVPVELVPTERVDDLDVFIADPEPRMETESPDVQQS